MKKNILILTVVIALGNVSGSLADEIMFSCTRYQSKCIGKACSELAAAMRLDSEKKILRLKNVEVLEYRVAPQDATEKMIKGDAEGLASRKYQVSYKRVAITPQAVSLSNQTPEGTERERIVIETGSGFYLYYIIHTDGSLKDLAVGEPYKAYFGWCENITPPLTSFIMPAGAK